AASPEEDAVVEALDRSSSLTPDARAMLVAMLPHSLAVLSNERDARQTMVVKMFEETIYGIKAGLSSTVEEASSKVAEAEAAKSKLAEQVVECESKLTERHEAVEAAKVTLAAKKETRSASEDQLKKADGDLQAFEAGTSDKQQLKARLEEVTDGELRKLREGSFADAKEAKTLAAALMKVTAKLDLEASLASALLPTCTKPLAERSSFDGMVLQQVAQELAAKVASLGEELGASAARLEEHRAAATAAKAASQAALEDLAACAAAFKDAQDSEVEAKKALAAASKASDNSDPAIEKAKKALTAAEAALRDFEGGAVLSFEALRDATAAMPDAPAPPAEAGAPAAEAPAAEAPAAEAVAEAEEAAPAP
ncbi:unnamed protein product, partial [Prorocentrum cordatum]